MPTLQYSLTSASGWVEVAADGAEFLVENKSPVRLRLTLQTAPPGASTPYHVLKQGDMMVRSGSGACYLSTDAETSPCVAVVTS